MRNVDKFVETRRKQLGWTEVEMAKRCGLSVDEYCDIEYHDYELKTMVPLMNVRRLADALNIPLHELLGVESMNDAPSRGQRKVYMANARQRLGATVSDMADAIGFYDVFVTGLEAFGNLLELYPYEVAETVANYLQVPPQHLLGRDHTYPVSD